MQAEVPLGTEALQGGGAGGESVRGGAQGRGVPEEIGGDGRGRTIDGMGGVSRDVKEGLGVNVRDIDAEVAGDPIVEGLGRWRGRGVSRRSTG
ncbi:MAG: hypothetical protein VW239_06700 [Candidatus Nanopelagicales bacterium]